MMRDFETYVGPDFIQPGEERLLRSYQPAQPRVNRQPETEVLVAVKEIGKPLKIVQPGTAYLGRNAVHKLQQGDCCGGGGPAKADDADVQALGETIKAKEKEIERLKNDAKQEKVKTDAEIQDLKKDISTKEEEIDGLKTGPTQEKVKTDAKIQALEETIKAKEKEIQVLKTGVTQEKTNTDVKIQKLEKTIEVKDAKINELDETIDDLKAKEKRIQKLQEHLVSTLPLEVDHAVAGLGAGQEVPRQTFDLLPRLATEIDNGPENVAQLDDLRTKLSDTMIRHLLQQDVAAAIA
eukprot:9528_1